MKQVPVLPLPHFLTLTQLVNFLPDFITKEKTLILPLYLDSNTNLPRVWSLYFTTHALRSSLQRHRILRTKLLNQGFLKEVFRKVSIPC